MLVWDVYLLDYISDAMNVVFHHSNLRVETFEPIPNLGGVTV